MSYIQACGLAMTEIVFSKYVCLIVGTLPKAFSHTVGKRIGLRDITLRTACCVSIT